MSASTHQHPFDDFSTHGTHGYVNVELYHVSMQWGIKQGAKIALIFIRQESEPFDASCQAITVDWPIPSLYIGDYQVARVASTCFASAEELTNWLAQNNTRQALQAEYQRASTPTASASDGFSQGTSTDGALPGASNAPSGSNQIAPQLDDYDDDRSSQGSNSTAATDMDI
jgi:hypothetical protein